MSHQVTVEVLEGTNRASVEVIEEQGTRIVEVTAPELVPVVEVLIPGPQGPAGEGVALPIGGNPGDILMKESYADGEADWAPTLDGGTFF